MTSNISGTASDGEYAVRAFGGQSIIGLVVKKTANTIMVRELYADGHIGTHRARWPLGEVRLVPSLVAAKELAAAVAATRMSHQAEVNRAYAAYRTAVANQRTAFLAVLHGEPQ